MRPQLHPSALGMFARCGEQFRRRYVEGERIPPGVAAVVGTGVHLAVGADLREKMTEGTLLPAEAVEAAARDGVIHGFEADLTLTEEEAAAGPKAAHQGAAIDRAVRLARLHHAEAAPTIQPVAVERPFALDLTAPLAARGVDYPLDLAGTMDVESDGGDAPNVIRDTKTKDKTPPAGLAETSLQLAAYSYAKKTLDGVHASRLALDCLVDLKTPKYVAVESPAVTGSRESALLNRIAVIGRALESGIFAPADPDAWWCSKRFCGYWETCPFAANPRSVAVRLGLAPEEDK